MNPTSTGNLAETAVAEELVRQGYVIICHNWKTVSAEIDIVAQKDSSLYFVEVKYRRITDSGDGFEAITARKLQHMQRAAETYVQAEHWQGSYELLAAAVTGEDPRLIIDIREI